jgi:hypothetical protein
MQANHDFICECGESFKTGEELTEHVAVHETLSEIKRIGGERFQTVAKELEKEDHDRNLQKVAENHDLELKPQNATEIAKKQINHMVCYYDEYDIDRYQTQQTSMAETSKPLVTRLRQYLADRLAAKTSQHKTKIRAKSRDRSLPP